MFLFDLKKGKIIAKFSLKVIGGVIEHIILAARS